MADDKIGTNAKFFARSDGKLSHKSIRNRLFFKEATADFTLNADLGGSAPGVNKWYTDATSSGSFNSTSRDVKMYRQITRRFGEDFLILTGHLEWQRSSDGFGVDGHARVYIKITGESAQEMFTTSIPGTSTFKIVMDISQLVAEDFPTWVQVDLEAFVDGLDSAATSNRSQAFLHDDIDLYLSSFNG